MRFKNSLVIWFLALIWVPSVFANNQQDAVLAALKKELAITQEMLSTAEKIMANADQTGDFTRYLAAKNQEIIALRDELKTLQRQIPAVMRNTSSTTAKEDALEKELDELQAKYSETLETLNDVESELTSLKNDYQNNIDKLAIYAQENEQLIGQRDQYREQSRATEEQLKEAFYVERRELQAKLEHLEKYNQELLLTKETVLERIETQDASAMNASSNLARQLTHISKKMDAAVKENKKLVSQKKELLKKVDVLASALDQANQNNEPVLKHAQKASKIPHPHDSKLQQQLKAAKNEILRLEQALNQKELHYNSMLHENDKLNEQFTLLSANKNTWETENKRLARELEEMHAANEGKLAKQVKPLKIEIARLETELGEKKDLLNKKMAKVKKPMLEKIKKLEDQIKHKEKIINTLETEKLAAKPVDPKKINKLESKISNLEDKLEEERAKVAKFKDSGNEMNQDAIANYDEEIKGLKEQLAMQTKKQESLQEQILALSREKENLNKDLNLYQAKMKAEEERYKKFTESAASDVHMFEQMKKELSQMKQLITE